MKPVFTIKCPTTAPQHQLQQQQQRRPLDRGLVRGDYGGGGGRETEGRREDRPEGHHRGGGGGRKAVAFESIDEEEEEEGDRRRPNVRLSLKMKCRCCYSFVLSC